MKLKKFMIGNRKVFFILILLFTIKIFGQRYKVMYDYSFSMDSTRIDVVENEIMVLDIDKDGSVFYSYPKFKYDSIAIEKNKKHENILEADKSKVDFFVEKKYPDYEMIYHTVLGSSKYAVENKPVINWKLDSEKKNIKGIDTQKAIADFGGRKWIAWYAVSIPIIDGPYKFSGLPGLIIEIEDEKKHHKFQFIGIENNKDGYKNFQKTIILKEKKVNDIQFNKEWKDFKKDPARDLKFTLLNSKLGFKINYDGKDYSVSDMIRNTEEREKAKIERNNNFIELTLYK